MYRERYYESLGFEFEVDYDRMLEAVIEELKEDGRTEIAGAGLDGELLSMAGVVPMPPSGRPGRKSVPEVYPKLCTLASLAKRLCPP